MVRVLTVAEKLGYIQRNDSEDVMDSSETEASGKSLGVTDLCTALDFPREFHAPDLAVAEKAVARELADLAEFSRVGNNFVITGLLDKKRDVVNPKVLSETNSAASGERESTVQLLLRNTQQTETETHETSSATGVLAQKFSKPLVLDLIPEAVQFQFPITNAVNPFLRVKHRIWEKEGALPWVLQTRAVLDMVGSDAGAPSSPSGTAASSLGTFLREVLERRARADLFGVSLSEISDSHLPASSHTSQQDQVDEDFSRLTMPRTVVGAAADEQVERAAVEGLVFDEEVDFYMPRRDPRKGQPLSVKERDYLRSVLGLSPVGAEEPSLAASNNAASTSPEHASEDASEDGEHPTQGVSLLDQVRGSWIAKRKEREWRAFMQEVKAGPLRLDLENDSEHLHADGSRGGFLKKDDKMERVARIIDRSGVGASQKEKSQSGVPASKKQRNTSATNNGGTPSSPSVKRVAHKSTTGEEPEYIGGKVTRLGGTSSGPSIARSRHRESGVDVKRKKSPVEEASPAYQLLKNPNSSLPRKRADFGFTDEIIRELRDGCDASVRMPVIADFVNYLGRETASKNPASQHAATLLNRIRQHQAEWLRRTETEVFGKPLTRPMEAKGEHFSLAMLNDILEPSVEQASEAAGSAREQVLPEGDPQNNPQSWQYSQEHYASTLHIARKRTVMLMYEDEWAFYEQMQKLLFASSQSPDFGTESDQPESDTTKRSKQARLVEELLEESNLQNVEQLKPSISDVMHRESVARIWVLARDAVSASLNSRARSGELSETRRDELLADFERVVQKTQVTTSIHLQKQIARVFLARIRSADVRNPGVYFFVG